MWKKFLYPLYVVLAIGTVFICLVVFRAKPTEPTYANSMVLNIPREMTINYGETYTLPNNYIIVQPAEAKSLLSHTVVNHAGEAANLNFDGSKFSAVSLGYYYINFSIPGKSETITDTLKIHIVKPEDDYISASQKLDSLTVDEVYALSDIFDITCPNSAEIDISLSNDKVLYYDITEKFLVKTAGSVTISIDISYKNKQQHFSFDFTLADPKLDDPANTPTPDDPEPSDPPSDNAPANPDSPDDEVNTNKTTIILKNITDTITLSVGATAEILYEITNPDNEVNQQVDYVIADNICSVIMNMSPYIIIQANATGSTTLTLISLADPSVSITINIVIT